MTFWRRKMAIVYSPLTRHTAILWSVIKLKASHQPDSRTEPRRSRPDPLRTRTAEHLKHTHRYIQLVSQEMSSLNALLWRPHLRSGRPAQCSGTSLPERVLHMWFPLGPAPPRTRSHRSPPTRRRARPDKADTIHTIRSLPRTLLILTR